MILYHYTCGLNLRGIAKYGLTVGDVPTDIKGFKSKIGVWLTRSEDPEGHGLDRSAADKKAFRLTVDLPPSNRLVKWSNWGPLNVTHDTIDMLQRAAGGRGDTSSHWYIYFGIVKPDQIIACLNRATGQTVANWQEIWPVEMSRPGIPPWKREAWLKALNKVIRRAARAAQSEQTVS